MGYTRGEKDPAAESCQQGDRGETKPTPLITTQGTYCPVLPVPSPLHLLGWAVLWLRKSLEESQLSLLF